MNDTSIEYQVTVTVPASIHDEWISYMTGHHVEEVVRTGCFTHAEILKVTDPPSTDGSTTYVNRYHADSYSDIERYREHFAAALQADHTARFGTVPTAVRTVSEVLMVVK